MLILGPLLSSPLLSLSVQSKHGGSLSQSPVLLDAPVGSMTVVHGWTPFSAVKDFTTEADQWRLSYLLALCTATAGEVGLGTMTKLTNLCRGEDAGRESVIDGRV